MTKFEEAWVQ